MGAFEQLFGPVRGEFEQKFSTNSNTRGGDMLKLRFDCYIIIIQSFSPKPHPDTSVRLLIDDGGKMKQHFYCSNHLYSRDPKRRGECGVR